MTLEIQEECHQVRAQLAGSAVAAVLVSDEGREKERTEATGPGKDRIPYVTLGSHWLWPRAVWPGEVGLDNLAKASLLVGLG